MRPLTRRAQSSDRDWEISIEYESHDIASTRAIAVNGQWRRNGRSKRIEVPPEGAHTSQWLIDPLAQPLKRLYVEYHYSAAADLDQILR